MTEFFAALVGALVGGGFALVATVLAAKRAANDAESHWRRDKQAQVLGAFLALARRPLVDSHAHESQDYHLELMRGLDAIRLWAPEFADKAAGVREASAGHLPGGPNGRETLERTQDLERAVRAHFGISEVAIP